ncbi:hypothetical protein CY34DRAFT_799523 [Suillus luteus UH-Slu-Lm8-n1]|uniref:Unplaced genomic scaffold CY34scaffold_17, whole genome shotgun sequence n=1 Tax=Suillus luteus UH-Slu-Lm8-n1 TaxID=930992 RepID=A0A0D0AAR1_9AGAM|nr:hypothetical protein CY34DRAFT_799523 [Suillus luteus UH-Slu-Lm8-n1]
MARMSLGKIGRRVSRLYAGVDGQNSWHLEDIPLPTGTRKSLTASLAFSRKVHNVRGASLVRFP